NLALFGVLMVFGLAFATPFNASNSTQSYYARWEGSTAAQGIQIEGGNISDLNLSATSLTDRWAAFFGNLTGTIYLTSAAGATTNYVYTWTVSTINSGYVCASPSTTFNFVSATPANVPNMNTFFGLGSAADNATGTFTTSTCTLSFSGQPAITSVPNAPTGNNPGDTFETCAIQDGSNYAFCVAANSAGNNYLGNPANYELMVPTTPGTGLMTYYFYAELA
ncbi:MAG: hypothetical protein N3G76_03180, partial [Candidatus Micrarchaeota archaeon]|nr:hypothetical protein [Candidatus Micrarchaeota archaeon]